LKSLGAAIVWRTLNGEREVGKENSNFRFRVFLEPTTKEKYKDPKDHLRLTLEPQQHVNVKTIRKHRTSTETKQKETSKSDSRDNSDSTSTTTGPKGKCECAKTNPKGVCQCFGG